MKRSISSFLNQFVMAGIILTLCALVLTPLVLTASLKHYVEFMEQYPYAVEIVVGCIYVCAAPYVYALIRLKKICTYFVKEEPFAPEIARGFQSIAKCGFADAILICAAMFVPCYAFESGISALTIFPAFIALFIGTTVGCLALVMASIFQKASEIKEENDSIF